MAFYDNEHWLLSHIRDSFLSTDNTGTSQILFRLNFWVKIKLVSVFPKGQCEMVMLGEDIPKQLKSNGMLQCYPGMEESDDEDLDALAESYDVQMGKFNKII